MTPRIRMLVVLALVALLTIPVGVAFAGGRGGQETASATGTSITQAPTTEAPTSAPPVSEAPTTEAPTTEAPPATEAPAPAPPPATEAPAPTVPPTTAAPAPVPTTKKPAPTTTAPTYVRTYPTASPEEWQKAMAFAHLVKYQQDLDWAASHPSAPGEPPATAPEPVPTDDPLQSLSIADQQFLQCVRWRESRGDYGAVNSSSGAGGAYQMLQSTWNNTAAHLGRGDLIGVRPNLASVHDQDMLAVHLLQWYGRSPWAGPGC